MFPIFCTQQRSTRLVEVLRYKPKGASSISDEVIGILLFIPGLNQPVKQICTRFISWGIKAAAA
jgi:hypothetical protein